MSCGVGLRRGWDPMLLWLWYRPTATAPIRPLAWEPPYAIDEALEKTKRQKKILNPLILKYGDYLAGGGWLGMGVGLTQVEPYESIKFSPADKW